jgi:protein-S-isoprenylcysteine O-methyltransferase Ste14
MSLEPSRDRLSDSSEDLLNALTGRDADAQRPVVLRTRRAIRIADEIRREQGQRGRRHVGITLFILGAIFVLLAPAIWGSIDDFIGGEHFGDLPAQVMLLSTFLMLAVVGALAAVWRGRARQDH